MIHATREIIETISHFRIPESYQRKVKYQNQNQNQTHKNKTKQNKTKSVLWQIIQILGIKAEDYGDKYMCTYKCNYKHDFKAWLFKKAF